MVQEAIDLYRSLGKRARIPEKALDILLKDGTVTVKNRVPYTLRAVYAVMNNQYHDINVDKAIIKACKQYIKENKLQEQQVRYNALAML